MSLFKCQCGSQSSVYREYRTHVKENTCSNIVDFPFQQGFASSRKPCEEKITFELVLNDSRKPNVLFFKYQMSLISIVKRLSEEGPIMAYLCAGVMTKEKDEDFVPKNFRSYSVIIRRGDDYESAIQRLIGKITERYDEKTVHGTVYLAMETISRKKIKTWVEQYVRDTLKRGNEEDSTDDEIDYDCLFD